jgi:hypothetical protein
LTYREELGDIKMEIDELLNIIGSGRIESEAFSILAKGCQTARDAYREVCGMPPFSPQEWRIWQMAMVSRGETFDHLDYGKELEHK